jgi:CheY-like chemotaxis protein
LLGDANRLSQVLLNLVGNAIKFTNRGSVRLTARYEQASPNCGVLQIDVSDTGLGMTPDVLKKLFQPFTQADRSTAREFGGTGLGLFISQEWAHLMGGTLDVRSEVGMGTTFSLRVPAIPDTAETPVPGIKSTGKAPLDSAPRGRVLVAEDHAVNRMITLHMLKKLGFEAEAVTDGQAVLAALQNGHFDAVLMDCQMPIMDGFSATRELRRRGAAVPVIALTAAALQEDRDACKAAGMDAYLTKPVDRDALDAALSTLLLHKP